MFHSHHSGGQPCQHGQGHHGHHGHHGQPAHLHDFTEANRRHFDESEALKYDDRPEAAEFARKIGQVILKAYAFDEDSTSLMDYACGTGLISRELAGYTKSIVGVDISQPMIDQFNTRVSNQGISAEEMKGICIDLKGQEGELDGMKFDVIVCASAYHHFSSPEDVTRTLAFFLKPGGTLLVGDIAMSEDASTIFPDGSAHIVAHRAGFNEKDMQKLFEFAGLQSFSFNIAFPAKFHGKDIQFFIAQGVKPKVL